MSKDGKGSRAKCKSVMLPFFHLSLTLGWATVGDVAPPNQFDHGRSIRIESEDLSLHRFRPCALSACRISAMAYSLMKRPTSHRIISILSKHHVSEGDVVIAALGETLAKSCIIPSWVGPALYQGRLSAIQSKRGSDASIVCQLCPQFTWIESQSRCHYPRRRTPQTESG